MRSDTLTRFYVVLHAPVNCKAPVQPASFIALCDSSDFGSMLPHSFSPSV